MVEDDHGNLDDLPGSSGSAPGSGSRAGQLRGCMIGLPRTAVIWSWISLLLGRTERVLNLLAAIQGRDQDQQCAASDDQP